MIIHQWANLRERSGYSQESLAQELEVSRAYVVKLEQGLFDIPPARIVAKLSELFNASEEGLRHWYAMYQRSQRLQFKSDHASFHELSDYNGPTHPLVYYREAEGLSQIGFCKGLCLHPGPVANYERNVQRSVPDQLLDAANDLMWSIYPLEAAVGRWRINGYADAAKIQA